MIDESAFIFGRLERGEEIPPGRYLIGDFIYIQGDRSEATVREVIVDVEGGRLIETVIDRKD